MWRYKLILFILFIPLTLYTLWKSLRALEPRYFIQRLGVFFDKNTQHNGIWFHTASVGEVNAVIPLILKLISNNPNLAITITSNTMTSAAIIKQRLPRTVQHYYFPLDYKWAIKHLLNTIKAKSIFIVETEFWPNLYHQAHKSNIPLFIINGRISEKTLYAKLWLRNIYAEILPLVSHIYTRSETDLSRFIELGANPNKIENLGNIKFDISEEKIISIDLKRDYVLAASTRENEEQLIVNEWIKAKIENALLVIAPRHPQRLNEILKQLKIFDLNISVRSKSEHISNKTDIYIADTIGELKQFIAGAKFVLMGGSFVPKGGHNILEVAQLGKAVIFGEDMRSFEDEASIFLQYHAGVQCSLAQLEETFIQFSTNLSYKQTIENNAKKLISENKNIGKYYNVLLQHI